jgi:hypothetical protein
MYVVQRAIQGSYTHSDWTAGFAWSELAGAVTTFDLDDFERLTEEDLNAEYGRLSVTP